MPSVPQSAPLLALVPLIPLVGAVCLGLLGAPMQRRLGRRAVHAVAVGAVVLSALLALYLVLGRLAPLPSDERALRAAPFAILHLGRVAAELGLLLDPLSAVMLLVVTLAGTLIHVYSMGYMAEEPSAWRYFACLNLFVSAMLLLVLGDNFVALFFGWEGVGLSSWLLIGFWYRERKNAAAGMKAFLVNRVGDLGLLLGVFVLFWALGGSFENLHERRYQAELRNDEQSQFFGVADADPTTRASYVVQRDADGRPHGVTVGPTLVFRELEAQLALVVDGQRPLVEGGELPVVLELATHDGDGHPTTRMQAARLHVDGLANKTLWGVPVLTLACLLLFLGVCGKSAQLPLHVWLPDAMAGPTPVSALMHAATMVTAGVYLLARLHFLFALSPVAQTVIAVVGTLTALAAALVATVQRDIKKVLAWSTVSQLGYMVLGAGAGGRAESLLHLVTHAAFKACLFLAAGSVIHAMEHLGHASHGDPHEPFDPQDLDTIGQAGLSSLLPWTRGCFFAGCAALAGLPFASGFFSKELILERAVESHALLVPGALLAALGLLAAAFTAYYSFRLYYLVFPRRAPSPTASAHAHEGPLSMRAPLAIFAVLAIILGPLLGARQLLAPLSGGPPAYTGWLAWLGAPSPEHVDLFAALPWLGASLTVAVGGYFAARRRFRNVQYTAHSRRETALQIWLASGLGLDALYRRVAVRPFLALSAAAAFVDRHLIDRALDGLAAATRFFAILDDAFDRHVVDGAVDLLAGGVLRSGRTLRRTQTGRINHYVLGASCGAVLLIIAFAWMLSWPG